MSESAAVKVSYINLGCRVNRVELDMIATQLEAAGFELAPAHEAALVVVNTCAVTAEAQAKTRKTLRRVANSATHPKVLATGCAAMLFADELSQINAQVVVEADKTRVAERACELMSISYEATKTTTLDPDTSFSTPTGRTRPGIKVQDGCDKRCSYCIVWKARGPSRSVEPHEVLMRVQEQADAGAAEVVLTGINLGAYGYTGDKGEGLAQLLDLLLEKSSIERIRLSSVEPDDVGKSLVRVIAQSAGRIAPYLHVPLQAGCDATLKRMRRTYCTADYRAAIERARSAVPELSLACDLIVAFPGESDAEFAQSLSFCEDMDYAHMHVFRYSKRPGTPAAAAPNQVPSQVARARMEQAIVLSQRMRAAHAQRLVGTYQQVCVQEPGRATTGGLFDVVVDPELPSSSLQRVHIVGVLDDAETLEGRYYRL